MTGKKASTTEPGSPARATLTSLPTEVVEAIADKLHGNDKVNLALCCKAMQPILCMGLVSARLENPQEPLTELTRCLRKQPNGVSHLRLFSPVEDHGGTRGLIDLGVGQVLILLCADAVCCQNLRTLSLDNVVFHLPWLQPVATRLRRLDIVASSLYGSAAGFLSAGWTALTALRIENSQMMSDVVPALNLPALEVLSIMNFCNRAYDHGGALQPDQLCCPQLCSLAIQIDCSRARADEGRRRCSSLLSLARLTTLQLVIKFHYHQASMDLGLPASVTCLTMQDGSPTADMEWALLEAANCIRGGAQLLSLTYSNPVSAVHPEGVPWGATTDAHYRELGKQLSGLTEPSVFGNGPTLLSAVGAVACSAPSLTRLKIYAQGPNGMTLPPICSASLQSITVLYRSTRQSVPSAVILPFLPGCTQLRDVHVQLSHTPHQGACVKISCHCNSLRCIVPFEGRAEFIDEPPWNLREGQEEVGVRFMPMPASPQGVQAYTVLFTCHAAGPGQAPKWDHLVMHGLL